MFKILAQTWKTCSGREVFILISLLFITFFQRVRRARVILLQHLISRRKQQRPKRVAWVLSRPQYWFETLLHSNALNMWWKENFRVSRETFNFICATVGPVIQRQDTVLRAVTFSSASKISFMTR